jgi:serine/threonine-protein kinase
MLVGTPRYMAPELIRGDSFGPPADLYALGLLAHELITGVHAVTGETPMAVLSRQIEQTSASLPADLALPAGLREVINRLSAKELSQRFESAQQALDALAAARAAAVSAKPAQTLDEAPAPLVAPAPAPTRSGEHAAPGAQRIVAAALAAAILLVAGIVGVGYWSNTRRAAPAAAQLTRPAEPPAIKAIEGIDRIADQLERSTGALKAPAAAAVEPAAVAPAAPAEPKPTAAQQLATSGGAGATQGSQKTVAKMARRVEDARGKKPDPRPDPRTPAPANGPAEPDAPAEPDVPASPEAPVEPEVKQPPRPVETRIEHIELKYTP